MPKKTPKRILVAIGELRAARALESKLKEEGYAVETAASGEKALNKFKTDNFDLILLDLAPKEGGFDILREFKLAAASIPIVVAPNLDSGEIDAGEYGQLDISLNLLIDRVNAILKRNGRKSHKKTTGKKQERGENGS